MNEAKGAEESSQGDIGSERGSVGVDAPLDGAVVEVAGGVGTEGIGLGDVGGNRDGHCHGCEGVVVGVVVVVDANGCEWV